MVVTVAQVVTDGNTNGERDGGIVNGSGRLVVKVAMAGCTDMAAVVAYSYVVIMSNESG